MLFAQDDKTNRTNNMNNNTTNQQLNTSTNQNTTDPMYNSTTTTSYSAYGIPNYVQMNFQTQYPAVSNLTWTAPTADWYHGYFSDNAGRYTHVYYSTDPYYNVQYYPERVVSYTVALPVLQTYVPDAVITTASNLYKHNLYDIAAMRGNNDQEMYLVRVFDNGELKSMWMDANGTAVTDVWRTEEDMNLNNTTDVNIQTSTNTNAAMDDKSKIKSKTKTEYSDGTEIKTKTKNGKTKTKVDD
jgi:hypothetical protein